MNWKTPLTAAALAGLGILGCQRETEPEGPWSPVSLADPSDSAATPSALDGPNGLGIIETPAPVVDKRAEAVGAAVLPATGDKLTSQRTRAIREGAARVGVVEAAAIIPSERRGDVSGRLAFQQSVGEDAVAIDVKLRGLTPGQHAIYLHDAGDCESIDMLDRVREGSEGDNHRGDDVGRLEVGPDGQVEATLTLGGKTLTEGPHSLVGQAVVVDGTPRDTANRRDAVVCALILPAGATVSR
jgi:Cu/Zn superoxide dismutase